MSWNNICAWRHDFVRPVPPPLDVDALRRRTPREQVKHRWVTFSKREIDHLSSSTQAIAVDSLVAKVLLEKTSRKEKHTRMNPTSTEIVQLNFHSAQTLLFLNNDLQATDRLIILFISVSACICEACQKYECELWRVCFADLFRKYYTAKLSIHLISPFWMLSTFACPLVRWFTRRDAASHRRHWKPFVTGPICSPGDPLSWVVLWSRGWQNWTKILQHRSDHTIPRWKSLDRPHRSKTAASGT